jgi:hypothetical protein
MERYSEALHHFEAAEAIFDARDVIRMGWVNSEAPGTRFGSFSV